MKTNPLSLIILVLCFSISTASAQISPITKSTLLAEYENIFEVRKVVYEEESYLSNQVVLLPDTHFLAGFVNQNQRMIGYLNNNYSKVGYQQKHWVHLQTLLDDSVKLHKFYFEELKSDENFNQLFLQLLVNYLSTQNMQVSDWKEKPVYTITKKELMLIASRFFYANNLDENGRVVYKTCVGDNGISELAPKPYRAWVEGFCVMVIMNDIMKKTKYNIFKDFSVGMKMNNELGVEGEEKLLLARNQLYEVMQSSTYLSNALVSEFEKNKDWLPFVIDE